MSAPAARPGSGPRLAALARIAAVKREADLARLAAVSGRLNASLAARGELDAALHTEIRKAVADPELPGLRALDRHILLAEQARSALDRRIAGLAAEREAERAQAALSFGKALALDRLRARLQTGAGPKLR